MTKVAASTSSAAALADEAFKATKATARVAASTHAAATLAEGRPLATNATAKATGETTVKARGWAGVGTAAAQRTDRKTAAAQGVPVEEIHHWPVGRGAANA